MTVLVSSLIKEETIAIARDWIITKHANSRIASMLHPTLLIIWAVAQENLSSGFPTK